MIIDHVKNWEMSPGAVDRRSNEVGTLSYFAGGLHFVKGVSRAVTYWTTRAAEYCTTKA